jgi:hypothetical protein
MLFSLRILGADSQPPDMWSREWWQLMRNTQEQKAETTKYEEGQRWYRAQSWCLCVSKTCLQTASQGLYCYYDQEYQVAVAVAAADTTT